MIKNKTLFILGAGASVPFGLPTGQGLRDILTQELPRTASSLNRLVRDCGYTSDQILEFSKAFLRSNVPSIDSFLATRPSFADIGRTSIVAAITPLQDETQLYAQYDSVSKSVRATSDWFGYLYGLMRQGVKSAEDLLGNPVSFITFNYDLSLERLLYSALENGFGLDEDEALMFARRFRIHHVYGSVSPHSSILDPFQYRNSRFPAELKQIASQIALMPSERPPLDPDCVEMILDAEQVFALGFGFDEMNCTLLGTASKNVVTACKSRRLFATAYGLNENEIGIRRQHLAWPGTPVFQPCTSLDLLRQWCYVLQ